MGDFLDKTGLARVKAKIDNSLSTKVNTSSIGVANGVAELNSNGKVPSSQLPSYVDDVMEYQGAENFPTAGDEDKIYVDTLTGLTYRWGGSMYVEISESLALGETSATAYRGDRGKAAYDHATAKGAAYTSGLYKITTNEEGHVTSAAAVGLNDLTDLGVAGKASAISNITRSGTTFTATRADGTTFTFDQQDNNTQRTNSEIVNLIYPVGSIYMSVSATSPATLFGGTWTQLKDRFLIGAGGSYAVNATGGATSVSYTPAGTVGSHTLTTAEIPAHSHGLNSHTHSVGAHSHGLNSHVHSGPSHNHNLNNKWFDGASSHNHGSNSNYVAQAASTGISAASGTSVSTGAIVSAGTGNTGGASGSTANSSAFNTGGNSGNTANSGSGGGHNHGFTGTKATISTMPPYLSVYMWKRTA